MKIKGMLAGYIIYAWGFHLEDWLPLTWVKIPQNLDVIRTVLVAWT
jgi:hypothetical protein